MRNPSIATLRALGLVHERAAHGDGPRAGQVHLDRRPERPGGQVGRRRCRPGPAPATARRLAGTWRCRSGRAGPAPPPRRARTRTSAGPGGGTAAPGRWPARRRAAVTSAPGSHSPPASSSGPAPTVAASTTHASSSGPARSGPGRPKEEAGLVAVGGGLHEHPTRPRRCAATMAASSASGDGDGPGHGAGPGDRRADGGHRRRRRQQPDHREAGRRRHEGRHQHHDPSGPQAGGGDELHGAAAAVEGAGERRPARPRPAAPMRRAAARAIGWRESWGLHRFAYGAALGQRWQFASRESG